MQWLEEVKSPPDFFLLLQSGFISGRFVGDSTRLINDNLHYLKLKDILGLHLLIDFGKAFDSSLSHFSNQFLTFSILVQVLKYEKKLLTQTCFYSSDGLVTNYFVSTTYFVLPDLFCINF